MNHQSKFYRFSIGLVLILFHSQIYSQKILWNASLQRSITYLNNYTLQDSCDYNIALLSKYLCNHYSRNDFDFDLKNKSINSHDQIIPHNFYGPIIGLKSPLSKDSLVSTYQATNGIEHIMLWGIYADELSLDSIAKKVFYENSLPQANIRNVCHVAISLYWAKNKISRSDNIYLLKLRNKYITNLNNGLVKIDQVNDDLLECMVGLLCMNKFGKIPKSVMDNFIKAQNADGGWAWDRNISSKSHPHATVLAYWILLQLIQKN